ncbi:MAG: MIP/aquaporin family protein [Acidimicrobiia bacterium]
MENWQKYLAEIFGTFVLVGIGTGALLAALATGGDFVLVTSLGFGFALMAALYIAGEVSGGHFNPAVSLAAFLDRRINAVDLVSYWVAQYAGAILASLLLWWIIDRSAIALTYTRPDPRIGEGSAFLAEIALTAIFVMVILAVWRSRTQATTAFLAIGIALAAVHLIGIPLSGASVNPARTLAPAIVGDFGGASRVGLWLYLVGPMLGAIVGWVLHKVIVEGKTEFGDDFRQVRDSFTG